MEQTLKVGNVSGYFKYVSEKYEYGSRKYSIETHERIATNQDYAFET